MRPDRACGEHGSRNRASHSKSAIVDASPIRTTSPRDITPIGERFTSDGELARMSCPITIGGPVTDSRENAAPTSVTNFFRRFPRTKAADVIRLEDARQLRLAVIIELTTLLMGPVAPAYRRAAATFRIARFYPSYTLCYSEATALLFGGVPATPAVPRLLRCSGRLQAAPSTHHRGTVTVGKPLLPPR